MSQRRRRILLIDDELGILKTIGKRLEVSGFEVITAMDGQDGLAKARLAHPDAIIVDLMLPKLTGMEVCAALKQDEGTRQIPLIIFTAKGRDIDEQLCRECGADAYLTKAQHSSMLIEQLEALLGSVLAKRAGTPQQTSSVSPTAKDPQR